MKSYTKYLVLASMIIGSSVIADDANPAQCSKAFAFGKKHLNDMRESIKAVNEGLKRLQYDLRGKSNSFESEGNLMEKIKIAQDFVKTIFGGLDVQQKNFDALVESIDKRIKHLEATEEKSKEK